MNARARHDRLTAGGAPFPSGVVTLADGTQASVGDLVITRRNDRRLRVWPTDWVTNGQRWRVRHVHDDGRLSVQDVANPRRRVTLPADYVAEHVRLGYATTIHAAQGITADTNHTVLTGAESRQQLYVALTRGRDENHLHLAMAGDGAEDTIIRPNTTHPPTAGDLLERILTRDDTAHSATTTARTLTDPATTLNEAATRYRDALATAAVHVLGGDWVSRIDTLADQHATAGRYGSAGNKDDRFDAFVLADTLRTDRSRLRRLEPDTAETIALRRACRARKDLVSHRAWTQTRNAPTPTWPAAACKWCYGCSRSTPKPGSPNTSTPTWPTTTNTAPSPATYSTTAGRSSTTPARSPSPWTAPTRPGSPAP